MKNYLIIELDTYNEGDCQCWTRNFEDAYGPYTSEEADALIEKLGEWGISGQAYEKVKIKTNGIRNPITEEVLT